MPARNGPSSPSEEPPPELDDDARSALRTGANELVHPLNLLRHLLGERYRVIFAHASGRLYVFESESGVPATIEVAPYRATDRLDEEALVTFERGYVRLRPAPALAINRAGTLEVYRDPGGGATPERIVPQLPAVDPMRAQAAEFLRVCRGEAGPPTGAAEAAEDLHLVSEMVHMRMTLPGAREALHAEREARGRMWEERVRVMNARRL